MNTRLNRGRQANLLSYCFRKHNALSLAQGTIIHVYYKLLNNKICKGRFKCVLVFEWSNLRSYFLTRFCIMVINACEICICSSVCFGSSSICSSCRLALASCSFLCSSSSCWRMEYSLWAFSFKNSTASPPLLRLFLALPPADSFVCFFFSRTCVPWLSFWFLQLLLYHLTFSCLWRKAIFFLT